MKNGCEKPLLPPAGGCRQLFVAIYLYGLPFAVTCGNETVNQPNFEL
jgi:hypothetical protein